MKKLNPLRALEGRLLLVIGGLCALAFAFLTSALVYSAMRADSIAKTRDQAMVAARLESWAAERREALNTETQWDEAVRNVDQAFNLEWVQSNFAWSGSDATLDRLAIVDGRGRTVYAAVHQAPALAKALAPDLLDAAPLIAEIRRREAARGPIAPAGAQVVTEPINAARFVAEDGRARLIVAALVQPDFGTVDPSARAPILVGVYDLTDERFVALMRDLMIAAAHVEPGVRRGDRTTNVARLALGDQPAQATIVWAARRPGSTILHDAIPGLIMLVLVTLFGGFLIVNHTRRLARRLVASQAHAQHVALHDAFTGLANRVLMADRLEQALERRRRFGGLVGVFCLDLDRFKTINDTLGHAAGDEVIREAARRIAGVCRATDTVARLGGDEFAIVQADAHAAEDVIRLAERLQSALSGVLEVAGGQARLSSSIGVAVIDDDCEPQEALRRADLALYRAKERGRARFALFDESMDESLRTRAAMAEALALALTNGEVEVVYQPQVTPRGRRILAVEALARWRGPQGAPIAPGLFIGVAEEFGLIDTLGHYVWTQACEDSRRWPEVFTAVNVSAQQLRRPAFLEQCRQIAAAAGVDPARMELETGQAVLLATDEGTATSLQMIKETGFRLTLDDFGAGSSHLANLKVYPIQKIKIDRSYIEGLGAGGETEAVIHAMAGLARAFGLTVAAVGVETQAQLNVLSQAGCTLAQGFFLGPPQSADEMAQQIGGAARAVA